jgi:outer membrane protein OmpA-like peptidoglycan-associated protein
MIPRGKKQAFFFLCIHFFFYPRNADSQPLHFRFSLNQDDVLIVEKYQDIEITDGKEIISREEKNRITLRVNAKEGVRSELSGTFNTYSRTPRLIGSFHSDQEFISRFFIHENGGYEVPEEYLMPNLRSLPTFPDRPVEPDEEWRAEAEEALDIDRVRIRIPLDVHYRYTGVSEIRGVSGRTGSFPRILYSYTIDQEIANAPGGIARISGYAADELWFDPEQGIPICDSNRLLYRFRFTDGRVVEYRFRIDSTYKKIRTIRESEKEKLAEKVEEDLKGESKITVRKSDEGIILDMNAVFFATDSAQLNADAEKKIGVIAEILKKFPDREIRISGHTDSTGEADHNLNLSQTRALSVLNELKNAHSIESNRMSYRGYGEERPIAENSSAEGREKNRRVEILIVTE